MTCAAAEANDPATSANDPKLVGQDLAGTVAPPSRSAY